MGGFAGHMMHLNDNPNLTFGQMKDVFNKASSGELIGTEKTDGQNLFVSYSVKKKQARAVRNSGEIKAGGLDPAGLADKFADRGDLTDTFVEGFDAFEKAVQSLPLEEQLAIFGPDANNFYNAEIMNPGVKDPETGEKIGGTANVIDYDTKSLLIHRVGHHQLDKMNRTTSPLKDEELVKKLETALKSTQQDQAADKYTVQVNAIRNLAALADDKPLKHTLARLDSFMSENGLSDSDTIGDYVVQTVSRNVDNELPNASQELRNMILVKILGQPKAATITQIQKKYLEDLGDREDAGDWSKIKEMVDQKNFHFKWIMYPLEDIVHDFAVEMLRGLESAFILDSEQEVRRLKDEVALAKKMIEDSGNAGAIEILKKQMEKLKDVENVSTATEGFVFDYDGNTYKFTGGFAPVNQLLGLFKYGRGDIPPLKKMQEQEEHEDFDGFDDDDIEITDDGDMILDEEKEKIYIYPGRFQPMGQHHAETYRAIAEEYGPENVYVATSDKVEFPKSPFNFEEKKEIMIRHGIPEDKIVQVSNPYNIFAGDPLGVADTYGPNGIEAVYFVGAKDMAEDPRFKVTSGVTKRDPKGYDWKIETAPHVSRDVDGFGEMSGTSLRNALERADEETFAKIMGWFDPAIYNLILAKLNELDEISTMASGAVQGGGKEDEKLIREEGMIMREEMIVEMKLRDLIQERIKNSMSTNQRKGIIYINERQKDMIEQHRVEHALRKCVRQLILQEKTEPIPHANTGINQLSELLKKIVPILSVGYKSLTTSFEQRESYRSHILNAVINALAPIKAEDDATPQALSEDDDELDITLQDPDEEEKFIDIEEPASGGEEEEAAFEDLPGRDKTGRNVAMRVFDRVERIILDSYEVLDDDQDQDLFYDYLLTNLKLYFDKFEEELEASPDEPTTPEYEEESSVTGDEAEALQEEVNPWAICTAKVGRKDKAKYEACVLAVKDEHGIAH
tara:strand:+ start:3655 stop:6546 length:2892 start_codon:yes stop_codon:yes gene_type:complete